MKKYVCLCALIMLSGCQVDNTHKIDAKQALAMMDEAVIILDVREKDEFESGHIRDAIQISLNDLTKIAETVLVDKNQVILVYCRSGNRSAKAAKILNQLNYQQVYDFGGIQSWPYEIVKE